MKTGLEEQSPNSKQPSVIICQYRSCFANGSAEVLSAFESAPIPGIKVIGTPECQGQCSSGPTVRVIPEETWYCRVKPSDIPIIVEEHLKGGKPVEAKLNPRIHIRFSF